MTDENGFIHPYVPNAAPAARRRLLAEIGVENVTDLYVSVPDELQVKGLLNLPDALPSEHDLRRHVEDIIGKNLSCRDHLNFCGAGCWQHYVPAICDEITGRGEFLTAYGGGTYSDHGKNQAIFEFQSLIGELVGMEVVGTPTYDMGAAVNSAVTMACRITARRGVLLSGGISADMRSQIRGFTKPVADLDLIAIDPTTGLLLAQDLNAGPGGRVATVSRVDGTVGSWVAPGGFTGGTFGVQLASGIGLVPAGEILYVSDVGSGLHSAPNGGPETPRGNVPGSNADDMYVQPDGDLVYVGDFSVGFHVFDPFTFTSMSAGLPNLAIMFESEGLTFGCGSRATVCPDTGEGFVSWSCPPGGTGVFRLDEALTTSTLLLTTDPGEGIQDLTVGASRDGSGRRSLYLTLETSSGAHQVWEITDICGDVSCACSACELSQLLAAVYSGSPTLPSTSPCFSAPPPEPGSDCCLFFQEELAPVLPGLPFPATTGPCFASAVTPAAQRTLEPSIAPPRRSERRYR